MILLTGIPSEPPLAMVLDAVNRENIPYILFNQREAQHCDIVLENTRQPDGGIIRLQEQEYRLEELQGVYLRLMDHRHLPEVNSGKHAQIDRDKINKITVFHELLTEWMEVASCRIMNRASDMGSNMSKPYQAQIIKRCGFKTPITLISNEPTTVRNFHKKYKRVIYKSISSIRSIVVELDAVKLMNIDKLKHLPTQFQAYVPGNDIRVHVAGNSLFATEVVSDAVDYRYANREDLDVNMKPVQLPQEVEAACYRLSRDLALPLCGIDLRQTPENEYFCFEVNPSPGYSYYQEHTGQDIAGAIARFLEYGTVVTQPTASRRHASS